MKKIKVILGIWILGFLGFQVIRFYLGDLEIQTRNFVQSFVTQAFSEAERQSQRLWGLKPLVGCKDRYKPGAVDRKPGQKSGPVILVHGLDEPGNIWRNLGPALVEKGFCVYRIVYPNDQAIHRSSRFFFNIMTSFSRTDPVTIICHSMGGLVTRNMLTHPEFNYTDLAEKGRVPKVKRLIMIGTPNHGSQLARLRIFLEIRDQIYHWTQNDAPWLNFILDGTGNAGVDLIPGSKFLTSLNARPLDPGIDTQIIAARIIPLPFFDGLGDGLVSLDSARLGKIPMIRVQGAHRTMIWNLNRDSHRVPPAIPIIMNQLIED